MTKIYIASYATCEEFEALSEDGVESVEAMARADNVAAVSFDRDKAIAKAKEVMIADMIDLEDLNAKVADEDQMSYNAMRRDAINSTTYHELSDNVIEARDITYALAGVIIVREEEVIE